MTQVECKKALIGLIGEGKGVQPSLVKTVTYVIQEHGASDWIASALADIIGVTQIAAVFPATSVM